jgi:hypothetical protein
MSGPPTCPRRRPVRLALIVPLAALVLLASALPAGAQADGDSDDTRVILTGRVDVASDERTGDVVIFDGPALIAGSVNGAVVAFNGDVRVQGEVEEDVVVFRGRAIVEDGATVGGDVV